MPAKKAAAPKPSKSSGTDSALMETLATRFDANKSRHKGVTWSSIEAKLTPAKLKVLAQMERTGGEPDVVLLGKSPVFVDCAPESPNGRRSLCYDRAGLESRKEAPPKDTAIDVAKAMGVRLLTEEEYLQLQTVGPFDEKTSSWVLTPPAIRKLGGALFGDYRYGRAFISHNGAQSYYAARGFRGVLELGA